MCSPVIMAQAVHLTGFSISFAVQQAASMSPAASICNLGKPMHLHCPFQSFQPPRQFLRMPLLSSTVCLASSKRKVFSWQDFSETGSVSSVTGGGGGVGGGGGGRGRGQGQGQSWSSLALHLCQSTSSTVSQPDSHAHKAVGQRVLKAETERR